MAVPHNYTINGISILNINLNNIVKIQKEIKKCLMINIMFIIIYVTQNSGTGCTLLKWGNYLRLKLRIIYRKLMLKLYKDLRNMFRNLPLLRDCHRLFSIYSRIRRRIIRRNRRKIDDFDNITQIICI